MFTGFCHYCDTPIPEGIACDACKALSPGDWIRQCFTAYLQSEPQEYDSDIPGMMDAYLYFADWMDRHNYQFTPEERRRIFGETDHE